MYPIFTNYRPQSRNSSNRVLENPIYWQNAILGTNNKKITDDEFEIATQNNHTANPVSRHNFYLHQKGLINKYLNLIKTVKNKSSKEYEQIKKELTILEKINDSYLENERNEPIFEIANKHLWGYLDRYMKPIIKNLKITSKSLKLAQIQAQHEILNAEYGKNTPRIISLGNNKELNSSIMSIKGETKPSITRGVKGLPEKIDHCMINAYYDQQQIDDDLMRTLRCGHIDNTKAAEQYVAEMSELSTTNNEHEKKIIIDNRLMYDTNIPFYKESHLITKHQTLIKAAIEKFNEKNPDNRLKIFFLNLPPKNFQSFNKNGMAIANLIGNIKDLVLHHELMKNDSKYRIMYQMLENHCYDETCFSGAKAYDFGFIIQYLSSKLGIGYSVGCKSNKDRGSMNKLHDEIFFAKLNLLNYEQLKNMNMEEFFNIKNNTVEQIEAYRNIMYNNSSALITNLNTSYPGNKNMAAMEELLKDLGFSDDQLKKLITGMSEYANS